MASLCFLIFTLLVFLEEEAGAVDGAKGTQAKPALGLSAPSQLCTTGFLSRDGHVLAL